jgi:hypothetical protein
MLLRSYQRIITWIAVFGVCSDDTDFGGIDVDEISGIEMDCLGVVLDESPPRLEVRGCSQLVGPLASEETPRRVLEVDRK